jgi:hypothetical protein
MPPFTTCPDCGAVLYMGSRCWNCSPPRVMQPGEIAEWEAAELRATFDLPESYRKHLRGVYGL